MFLLYLCADQIRAYDTDLDILTPQMCFQAAIAHGSIMLLLIPEKEIDINEELEASASQLLLESDSQMETGVVGGCPVVLGKAYILKTL